MRTAVAVLRGGPMPRYDASLASGSAVIGALDPDRFEVRDVLVSPDSYWHAGGVTMPPERALRGADLVFNCLHGRYGADGWLQQLVSKLGHRVVGSRPGPLALAYNKEKAKMIARRLDLRTPAHQAITREQDLDLIVRDLFRSFPMPAVVKPSMGSGGAGISFATDLSSLRRGIEDAHAHAPRAIVEEYVGGTDATAGIVDGLPGEPPHAFAAGEIAEAHQNVLKDLAWRMHAGLGLSHYSASDFIVNSRGVWYIETNALPELHPDSPFARGLEAHGVPMREFVDHVIALARK